MLVEVKEIHIIPDLRSSSSSEHLIRCRIPEIQAIAELFVCFDREKPKCGVEHPLDARALTIPRNKRTHESRKRASNFHCIACTFQRRLIFGDSIVEHVGGVVEHIDVSR